MGNPSLWGPSGGNLADIALRIFFLAGIMVSQESSASAAPAISDADHFKEV